MANAKQIKFTYRNNFYVQACAYVSQRSLIGSEVLHFFCYSFCDHACFVKPACLLGSLWSFIV